MHFDPTGMNISSQTVLWGSSSDLTSMATTETGGTMMLAVPA